MYVCRVYRKYMNVLSNKNVYLNINIHLRRSMSSDIGETENFLFIAIGCGFTVVAVGAGILVYYLAGCCCKRCKKDLPQIQIDSSELNGHPDPAPQKICFICGEPRDQVGSNHYNCSMDSC